LPVVRHILQLDFHHQCWDGNLQLTAVEVIHTEDSADALPCLLLLHGSCSPSAAARSFPLRSFTLELTALIQASAEVAACYRKYQYAATTSHTFIPRASSSWIT
jgi:hypothetical protein